MKSRSASEIADALECYRMKSERQRKNCKNKSCHYNNNDTYYGCYCCSNSILHDAVEILREREAVVHPEPSCEMTYTTDCCCDLCGVQLIREDNFCRCCGKRIEWEWR